MGVEERRETLGNAWKDRYDEACALTQQFYLRRMFSRVLSR